jgi:hypothetical protein
MHVDVAVVAAAVLRCAKTQPVRLNAAAVFSGLLFSHSSILFFLLDFRI